MPKSQKKKIFEDALAQERDLHTQHNVPAVPSEQLSLATGCHS